MEWYHDFCLFCDKQTAAGAYCSQACRLADLERSGYSEPSSPLNYHSSHRSSWQPSFSVSSSITSQFQLPPALDFSAYRSAAVQSSSSRSVHTHQATLSTSSSSSSTMSTVRSVPPKRLNSSSSRSSLSSMASGSTAQGLTDADYSQLRDYSNSFDQVRTWKRRATSG